MKCRKCGGTAVLELRRHNAAFCAPDFIEFFRRQVGEAVRRHRMFTREESVLVAVSGGQDLGAAIQEVQGATRRPTCSACGLSKRYLMNKAALEQGFPVVATGHNLDDEAATLFGSILHWQTEPLAP